MPTLHTLSDMLGVSPATISRVLNGNPNQRISEAKRRLINETAKKYGYRPSSAGRSLVTRKTLNVAYVMHYGMAPVNVVNPTMMMGVLMSLERTLQDNHYGLNLVFISREDPEGSFKKLLTTHRSFDALVFASRVGTRKMVEMAAEYETPTAALIDSTAGDWPTNFFHIDEEGDVARAVQYIWNQGHRDIAIVAWDPVGRLAPTTFSKTAYDALQACGYTVDDEWIHCVDPMRDPFYSHRDQGRDAMRKILQGSKIPTAVICRSDLMAYGVRDAMNEFGLKMGKDIAVIGHGNIEQLGDSPHHHPVITTFDPALADLGKVAADTLLQQIKTPNLANRRELYPSRLIERESTLR